MHGRGHTAKGANSQLQRPRQQAVQLRVAHCRGGDAIEHLQLARAFAHGLLPFPGVGLLPGEEAHVVNGQSRLIGKGESQLLVLRGEGVRLVPVDGQDAQTLALDQQGHAQPGANVGMAQRLEPVGRLVGVVDDVRLARLQHRPDGAGAFDQHAVEFVVGDAVALLGRRRQFAALKQHNGRRAAGHNPVQLDQDTAQQFVLPQTQCQAGDHVAQDGLALTRRLLRLQ